MALSPRTILSPSSAISPSRLGGLVCVLRDRERERREPHRECLHWTSEANWKFKCCAYKFAGAPKARRNSNTVGYVASVNSANCGLSAFLARAAHRTVLRMRRLAGLAGKFGAGPLRCLAGRSRDAADARAVCLPCASQTGRAGGRALRAVWRWQRYRRFSDARRAHCRKCECGSRALRPTAAATARRRQCVSLALCVALGAFVCVWARLAVQS